MSSTVTNKTQLPTFSIVEKPNKLAHQTRGEDIGDIVDDNEL